MRARLPCVLLTLLSACASPSAAPTDDADRAEVLAVAQAFFDVIASGDAEAGARLVVPEGTFVNIREQDGARVVRHFTNASWLAGLGAEERALFEAWDGEPSVQVDGDVAVVTGRYVFEVDGAQSHVGTDVFCLVRTDEGWRIAGGVYSVER